ncbi:MAG: hypothetical protein KKA73_09220 [Chloroflexi bacterium]|nr:hypothetical protein [Chloroflexota bacterium]MBU1747858.1 hypothetical protein [Chloroflexota bacterium]
MLLKLYVGTTSRVTTGLHRLHATTAREEGDSLLEYAILAAVVLAVLAVGVLLLANSGHDQAQTVSSGIDSIPVGNFAP